MLALVNYAEVVCIPLNDVADGGPLGTKMALLFSQ